MGAFYIETNFSSWLATARRVRGRIANAVPGHHRDKALRRTGARGAHRVNDDAHRLKRVRYQLDRLGCDLFIYAHTCRFGFRAAGI